MWFLAAVPEFPTFTLMQKLAAFLIFVYAAIRIWRNVFLGGMPFWYDPARDLTLAGDMFQKFSFLGQPSGIPGFFYPPHWLWWLFSWLHVSPDPRLVTFGAITLPYLLLFPLGLFLLRRHLASVGSLLVATVFVLLFDNYFTQLWNLNLAPLILLWIVVAFDRQKTWALGALCAFLVSFDFALGIPVTIVGFFASLSQIIFFLLGAIIVFLPTIAFEAKNHGQQIGVLLKSVGHKVVGKIANQEINGLTKLEIFQKFLPAIAASVFSLTLQRPARLTIFLVATILATLVIFLLNSNPIWPYHFLGLELLLLLLVAKAVNPLLHKFELPITLCLTVFLILKLVILQKTPDNIFNFDDLTTRRQVAEFILLDQAKTGNLCGFASFSATPFERNYEFEYLLNFLAKQKHLVLPKINSNQANCVYVAFPKVTETEMDSYLDGVTHVGEWGTAWKKTFDSGLTVVLRARHENI